MAKDFLNNSSTSQSQSQNSLEFGERMQGVQVVKKIVYGNVTKHLKNKVCGNHTHSWKCYLRPYEKEDTSRYIKKVQFKLHESYANPIRICYEPPYEIDETGWGEFEIIIKIFFVDPNERAVTITHPLKLFKVFNNVLQSVDTLVSEHYDELIFSEPTKKMFKLLQSAQQQIPATILMNQQQFIIETDFKEKEKKNLQNISQAKKNIITEIMDFKRKINWTKNEILKYNIKISKLEKQLKLQTTSTFASGSGSSTNPTGTTTPLSSAQQQLSQSDLFESEFI